MTGDELAAAIADRLPTKYTVTVDVEVDSIAQGREVLAAMEEAAGKLDAALLGYSMQTDDAEDVEVHHY